MAKFLQETIHETALQSKKKKGSAAEEFSQFVDKVSICSSLISQLRFCSVSYLTGKVFSSLIPQVFYLSLISQVTFCLFLISEVKFYSSLISNKVLLVSYLSGKVFLISYLSGKVLLVSYLLSGRVLLISYLTGKVLLVSSLRLGFTHLLFSLRLVFLIFYFLSC